MKTPPPAGAPFFSSDGLGILPVTMPACRRHLAAVVLLLFIPSFSNADGLPATDRLYESWRWSRFGMESGVPSGRVNRIVETRSGQTWALTADGLAWFDEFSWSLVTRNSPPSETIEQAWIAEDRNGVLLAGDGALYRVDTSGYNHVPLRWQGRPLPVRRASLLGRQGILIQSDSALFLFRDDSLALLPSPYQDPISPRLADRPFGIWPAKGGEVWLNARQGLFRSEKGEWVLKQRAPKDFFHIYGLADDGDGNAVVSLEADGRAVVFSTVNGKTRPGMEVLPGQYSTALDIGPGGSALVVFLAGDVYEQTGGRRRILEPLPSQLENVTCLRFRANGDLWVGSDGSIQLCRLSSTLWSVVRDSRPGGNNNVNSVLAASDGSVWAGTSDGVSITRQDGTTGRFDHIEGIRLGIVTGLVEDDEGGIWVSSGSSFEGALRWFNGRWTRFGPDQGLPACVHNITLDRERRLWFLGIGHNPVGLYPEREPGAFRYEDGRFVHLGVQEGAGYGRVYDVAQRSDSSLWFATVEGLSVLHHGKWKRWTTASGLREEKVFTVAVDADDRVWFGHQWAVGLGCIERSGEVRYYTTEDGLVSNGVWDVLVDSTGRVWASTRGGISSYFNGIWTSYTTVSGLPNSYTWPLAARNGSLYVGTMGGGMAVFRYGAYDLLPPVVNFTGPFERAGQTVLQWHAHSHWGEIPLERVETRYMLDGGRWSPWGRYSEVALTDPDHGEHVLQVQTKGFLGNVTPMGRTLRFSIAPPLYLRPYFVAPILLLFALGTTAIMIGWIQKRRHTAELRESEQRYRIVAEQTGQMVYDYDVPSGRIHWSGAIEAVTGYTAAEFSRVDIKGWEEMIHPVERKGVMDLLDLSRRTGNPYRVEYRFRHRMGGYVHIADNGVFLKDSNGAMTRMLGSMNNISSRKVAEEQILASLSDKEILLKEIHHRVKNNMQIVSSLLNLQANAVDDQRIRESFRESQNRIRSMALVHEKLYRSGSLARIDFGEYVRHLASDLMRSYGAEDIKLTVRAAYVELGVDAAVPCGLIVHELVSNAVKHGFRGREGGTIDVSISVQDDGRHVLSVSDDGAGFPPHIDFRTSDSLGLQLVSTLTAQLGGTVSLTTGAWTTFTIRFTPPRS